MWEAAMQEKQERGQGASPAENSEGFLVPVLEPVLLVKKFQVKSRHKDVLFQNTGHLLQQHKTWPL